MACGADIATAARIAADIVAGARGGESRAEAEQHGEDRDGLRVGKLGPEFAEMAAGDVAGLVRQHADELVWRRRFQQGAGIDEDAVPVHHEGVERAIIDDDDADILLGEPGHAQDRLRVVAQQLLDLRIADDRESATRLRRNGRGHARQRDGAGRHGGDRAKRALSQLALDRSVCCAHSN